MRLYPVLLVFSSSVLAQGWRFVARRSNAIHQLTFAPHHHHHQLSNQPFLICYNRGPSGPYYSNPCDVIPKHCFLPQWENVQCSTWTQADGFPHSCISLCSSPWASHQHEDKDTVIAPMDHFINRESAANTGSNNASSLRWAEKKKKTCVCSRAAGQKLFFFCSVCETVTGSLGCTACTLCTVRGDASCVHVWVAPNEVSCLTTRLNVFSSLSFTQAWFGLCSFQYRPVNPERFCRPSNRPINTVTGREVCIVRSQDLSSCDRPAGDVQHVARWPDAKINHRYCLISRDISSSLWWK